MTHDVSFGTANKVTLVALNKNIYGFLTWNLKDKYNAIANYIHWVSVSLV
jgi:hypothetical protein